MNNTKAILEDMRKITMLTGDISTIHQQSMTKWPYLAFEGVDEVEVRYDLTKDYTLETGEGYVHFHLTVQPEYLEPDLLEKRCESIVLWVRDMFWSEIRVKIFFNEVLKHSNSSLKNKSNIKTKTDPEFMEEVKDGPKQD